LRTLLDSAGIDPQGIDAVCVSCVVPPMQNALEEMSLDFFGVRPLMVGPGIKTGLSVLYDNPREVGADRIANALAAYEEYGGPVVIVDLGTATTFCAVSARGEYLGGAIAPGLATSAEALFSRAAKLPRVAFSRPKTVIGKDTVSSIQSGLINGYIDLVDGMVRRVSEELGGNPTVIGTGGLIDILAGESSTIQHVDHLLTLKGLRIIYQKNL
jgi:type III pantothenate kinase